MRKKGIAFLMAVMMAVQPVAVSAAEESISGEQVSVTNVELPDSEELLQGYLDQQLADSGENSLSAEYGKVSLTLSGWEKKVYDILKKKIAEVAAGTSTSTSFFISYGDLGLKESYTAAELTAATGVTVSAIASQNGMTASAKKAVDTLISGDIDLVETVLLAECPYELYWFDKSKGFSWTSGGCSYNTSVIKLDLSDGITCSFAVSADYAGVTEYTTNGKPARVTQAVANAKKIVAKYKSKSDYEKLKAYKSEICKRVSYNTAAASNSTTSFKDPWQLIYVLDNDTTNQVVCEGYAKAFKYLCDLTTFSGNVACYTVTGRLVDSSGAVGHMWNIVRVNSKSFLVDVTNCDGSSAIGYPDKLFLKGIVTADGDSGSVGSGYIVRVKNSLLDYVYDSNQTTLYGTAVLTLANHNATKSDFTKKSTAAKKVTLSKKKITLKKGKTYQISAKVTPTSCTQKKQYSSSDTSVATVSSKGVVKAKKKGTAKITVKVGTKKAVLTVKVK